MAKKEKLKPCCMNCENAHKRSPFDFKQYGNYGCPYECCHAKDKVEYKRCDDVCESYIEKKIIQRIGGN